MIRPNVHVLGCDETVVNTGVNNGVLGCLELKIGKSVQWAIFHLHFNGLTLRHLFDSLDGPTFGPTSYISCYGKSMKTCELPPVVTFEPVNCTLLLVDVLKLKHMSSRSCYARSRPPKHVSLVDNSQQDTRIVCFRHRTIR